MLELEPTCSKNVSLFLIVFYAGSIVVEHIFSGRRDTISLRHASINLEVSGR